MSDKLIVSLAAAVALFAAAGGVARADPNPTHSDEDRSPARSSRDAGIDAAGTGNPAGQDHRGQVTGSHSSLYDQINAAEAGSPDSVDNKDEQSPPADGNGQDAE